MKERPILFSAPMVRAILAGTKTQTRRAAKPRRNPSLLDGSWSDGYVLDPGNREWLMRDCPYGEPGDRLWVKETFRDARDFGAGRVLYRASGDTACGWKPSIFMPRELSRLTLDVADVRLERLQDISDRGPQNDCTAEGVFHCGMDVPSYEEWSASGFRSSEKYMYRQLWESINGAGSWDANPWVWVVEFRRAEPLNVAVSSGAHRDSETSDGGCSPSA